MDQARIEKVKGIIESLKEKNIDLFNKSWGLRTWDLTQDEIDATVEVATALKELYAANVDCSVFNGPIAVSQFRDNSTRTRFSFAKACNLLGMNVQEIDEAKSQIAHGETVRETANMVSFLTQVFGIRDDKFIGVGHEYQETVDEALQFGYDNKVLPQRPCVINLQCDQDHPTQSMSDLSHIVQTLGGADKIKGKKICMSWAYSPAYGKPLSVPQGIITLLTRYGADVVLAHPEGYELLPDTIEVAEKHAKESGGSFKIVHDMDEAVKDAHVVYPKSWAPFAVMQKRTELIKEGKADGPEMTALEQEALENNKKYMDWCFDERREAMAHEGNPIAMHCLPADVKGLNCEEGEWTRGVFDKHLVPMYEEAGWKPYIIAAMIMTTRFEDPAETLEKIIARGKTTKL